MSNSTFARMGMSASACKPGRSSELAREDGAACEVSGDRAVVQAVFDILSVQRTTREIGELAVLGWERWRRGATHSTEMSCFSWKRGRFSWKRGHRVATTFLGAVRE
jgi:hypothetical protein